MIFTDDDLKRVKEIVSDWRDTYNWQDSSMFIEVRRQQLGSFLHYEDALIARLEDSEERLNAVGGVLNLIHSRYKNDLRQNERAALESAISLIQAWRKAMGK